MDMYEEMLLQIVDILKKHNRPIPDLTHKEAIEEIRKIISGVTTYAENVTPDDIKKLDNTDSSIRRTDKRLIDADELKEQFKDRSLEDFTNLHFIDAIDNAPTVEYPFYAEAYQTGYEEGKNDYYHLDNMPDPECTVKLKDNPHKCGNCKYLIFKDYKHNSGTCTINRLERSFTDICTHEEDKM